MQSILWRILIAVVVVIVVFALIGPVLRVFGIAESGDLSTILRVVIGGLALLYILSGDSWINKP